MIDRRLYPSDFTETKKHERAAFGAGRRQIIPQLPGMCISSGWGGSNIRLPVDRNFDLPVLYRERVSAARNENVFDSGSDR
jgi:hypothetical protein